LVEAANGGILQEIWQLVDKTRDDAQTELVGIPKHQVGAVAAAVIKCKKRIVAGKALPLFVDEYSCLGQHSDRKAQTTTLLGSFFLAGRETLIPWEHMMLCYENPLAPMPGDFLFSVTGCNGPAGESI